MNRADLIEYVSVQAGISKNAASHVIKGFISTITDALSNKEEVTIVGFGTFRVSERAKRAGRNPSTGESITIDARTVPGFSAGKSLKDSVNH